MRECNANGVFLLNSNVNAMGECYIRHGDFHYLVVNVCIKLDRLTCFALLDSWLCMNCCYETDV